MKYDILIPGHYFCDIIFTGIPALPKLGHEMYTAGLNVVPGGVMNTVVGLQRLGVQVGWAGALGDDFFSLFIDDWITREGIDSTLLSRVKGPMQRVTVALSYPADRAFVSYVDGAPGVVEMTRTALEQMECSHLHIAGMRPQAELRDLLRECRGRGMVISLDPQHQDDTLTNPVMSDILKCVDIFLPNAREATFITGTESVSAAGGILREIIPYVVIKDGANGATAWRDGGCVQSAAIDLQPLDTTGAGDVFNAGFLMAYLRGEDTAACLRWGNICGGLSTLGYGGCASAPTLERAAAHFSD